MLHFFFTSLLEFGKPSLGAAYVSDAQYNRNVPFQTSPQAIRLYYFYNHWAMRMATYFFTCVNLSLALFEEPVLFLLPFLKLQFKKTGLVQGVCCGLSLPHCGLPGDSPARRLTRMLLYCVVLSSSRMCCPQLPSCRIHSLTRLQASCPLALTCQ
ncbi:uncharacterized protein LOC144249795 isoform X2 [Urocitellus parryii]